VGNKSFGALCVAALAFAPAVQALEDTTVTALAGTTCAGDRLTGLNCTANEFVVTATAMGNNITACHFNDSIPNVDVDVAITSSSTDRYNIGLFIGENGQAPDATGTGSTCSVATFPTVADPPSTSTAWFDAGGNTCGDYHGGSLLTHNLVQGVTLKCIPAADGNLFVPFTVTYSQTAGDACAGPSNVVPGTKSKCTAGNTSAVGTLVTFNADPACGGKTVTYDPVAGTGTAFFIVQNNDPNNAVTADSADGTQYHDAVPGPFVVTGAICQVLSGAASCGTGPVVVGNDVSGTLPTFPTGSSVKITISGTIPGGQTGLYSNTADVIPPANLTAGSDVIGNNSCTNSVTLPVKLQSFDVH
jgi:hypothetical protein